ncbi:MAG: hypothetical protein KDE33_01640 [Bacteroidetes bacterium]|nr:hypothetical protein [Bacteroidota bacterium]
MKKRLSKIARDLNTNISYVVEFLRANGIDCQEDPNESFSEDIVELIENNFSAFISEKTQITPKPSPKPEGKKFKDVSSTDQIPLELRIIDAASKEKKLIERIVGFTDFDWSFTVAKYKGVCSQPVDFSLFDEVLCDLLLTEQMSATKIGTILGLDIEKDPAEKEILFKAIQDLKDDKMLEGDESIMWLSETGIDYAKHGVKFSTFNRQFELYFDLVGDTAADAKSIFSKLKSEKISEPAFNLPTSLDEIKRLAEHQAPEIHFPDKNYLLQSAEFISADSFKARLWVVLLEDFRENNLRALVYDEKQNKIIESLSEVINQKDQLKTQLLEKLVKIDEGIEYTQEEKQNDQLEAEAVLIQKQIEIDDAINSQDVNRITEIQNEVVSIKRHFDSIEFEVELKRLFDETAEDLWIISPWIKNATFKRIPFFESYLKKGGKIFIAYSEPEEHGQVMAYDDPLNKLLELEKKYQNFYLHQLPPFHYKNVWLRNQEGGRLYYTGSYNILSFFVKQGLQKVRQEKMTRMDWNSEVQEEYIDVIRQFGLKYANKAIDDFNLLCQNPPEKIDRQYLQKLKSADYSKLKPFINQGIEQFDAAYDTLEVNKIDNLNYYRKIFFESKIHDFKNQAIELSNQSISPERKKKMETDFEKLRDEFMDFLELQMSAAQEVSEMLANLKTFNYSKHSRNKSKRR